MLRDREPIVLSVGEHRINIENHAAKRVNPMANDLTDHEFGEPGIHDHESTPSVLTGM